MRPPAERITWVQIPVPARKTLQESPFNGGTGTATKNKKHLMPQTKFHIIGFNPLKSKFLVKNSEKTADAFTYKHESLESAVEEFSSATMKSVSKIQEERHGNEVHILAVVKGDTSTPRTTWMHSEEMTETSPALDSTLSVLGLRNGKKD